MDINLTIDGAIYDTFAYEDNQIVVFNNRQSNDAKLSNLLMLGKVIHIPNGSVIMPVNEDEYDDIANYYLSLKSAFLGQEVELDEE